LDSSWRTIWIADAHRDDDMRSEYPRTKKPNTFLKLKHALATPNSINRRKPFEVRRLQKTSESGVETYPRGSSPFPDVSKINSSGKRKERTMYRLTQLKKTTPLFLVALGLAWLGLSPALQAVMPAPDGGYPAQNTAEGQNALFNLTTGSRNTADGFEALMSNTSGSWNTADGFLALEHNTTGDFNTASGVGSLSNNDIGTGNTAAGSRTLFNSKSSFNVALGFEAGNKITSGNRNICIGAQGGDSLTSGNNNIDIGNSGVTAEANTIRIGKVGTQTKTFLAGVSNAAVTGMTVVVNSSGQLGAAVSSARFKDNIQPMDQASKAILDLKPVTFHYKKEIDPAGSSQFGLVAEDVEKVNPDLVVRDKEGKAYSVRYDAVNAMFLNEFLKEHRKVEQQQKQIDALTAELKEQAAQIQKVNAQLEANKPAPQVVNNP
jgi:hypothetical protein